MGGASAYIDHADAIGSTTMETDPSGTVVWDMVNGPWGQAWQETGTRQSAVFAGMDWQVNDPLMPSATREYSDGLGRWMTPDPGGVKVVSLANPQTWNMYAYVTDNPTTLNDPSGLKGGKCSYTNLGACFLVLNNPHASASEENSSHQSAHGVNSEQGQSKEKLAERVVMLGEALVNFEIAKIKISSAGLLGAASPESGGATAVPAALFAISASGNIAAGGAQLVGAATGEIEGADHATKAMTAATSPVGVITLVATGGNMRKAVRYASWAGVLTSSPKDLLNGSAVQVTAKVLEFIQKVKDAF